jgi:hypothetical protein
MVTEMESKTGMKIASAAITRGKSVFDERVKVICSAATDGAQLPRVLAYIVAQYAVRASQSHSPISY